jgi:hypothetical protein
MLSIVLETKFILVTPSCLDFISLSDLLSQVKNIEVELADRSQAWALHFRNFKASAIRNHFLRRQLSIINFLTAFRLGDFELGSYE